MKNKNTMTIGEPNNIMVELSEADALLFLEYRKYQDAFKILLESGMLNTKSGSVVVHFDLAGQIRKIDKSEVLFLFVEKHM